MQMYCDLFVEFDALAAFRDFSLTNDLGIYSTFSYFGRLSHFAKKPFS